MMVRPLAVAQAAPSLPLTLARIARTPSARLALVYRLVCRSDPPKCSPARCQDPNAAPPDHAPPWGDPRLHDPFPPPLRPLGEALLLDRLVTGGILGTELHILDCNAPCDPAGPIGEGVDLHA